MKRLSGTYVVILFLSSSLYAEPRNYFNPATMSSNNLASNIAQCDQTCLEAGQGGVQDFTVEPPLCTCLPVVAPSTPVVAQYCNFNSDCLAGYNCNFEPSVCAQNLIPMLNTDGSRFLCLTEDDEDFCSALGNACAGICQPPYASSAGVDSPANLDFDGLTHSHPPLPPIILVPVIGL